MNKLTKGSLATGAGLVLLLGGAGTFMSWNAGDKTDGGTISTGHLTVSAEEAPEWSVNSGSTMTTATMEKTYLAAPGDTIVYEVPISVNVAGDNLRATLQATSGGLTGDGLATAFGASEVQVDLIPAVEDEDFFGTATDGVYALEEGSGEATARITLQFANGAVGAENAAMNQNIELGDLTVALTQTSSAAAPAL